MLQKNAVRNMHPFLSGVVNVSVSMSASVVVDLIDTVELLVLVDTELVDTVDLAAAILLVVPF